MFGALQTTTMWIVKEGHLEAGPVPEKVPGINWYEYRD
jgi:hypothetical protein